MKGEEATKSTVKAGEKITVKETIEKGNVKIIFFPLQYGLKCRRNYTNNRNQFQFDKN